MEQIYEALVDSLNNCEAFIEEEDGDDDEMMGMDEDEEDENSTNWLDGALAVKHKSEDDLVGRKIRINWGEEDGGWAVGVVTSYEGKVTLPARASAFLVVTIAWLCRACT